MYTILIVNHQATKDYTNEQDKTSKTKQNVLIIKLLSTVRSIVIESLIVNTCVTSYHLVHLV